MSIPSFTDLKGRTWRLELNYGLAAKINGDEEVDLANAHNGEALQKIGRDPLLFIKVLTMLVEAQLVEQNVTPEAFVCGLSDATLADAGTALEEMIELFTRPAMRPVLTSVLLQAKEGRTAAIELAVEKLSGPQAKASVARAVAELGNQIDQALAVPSTGTSSPGNGQESPASIPDPTA